jgi:hypothetical protein
MFNDRLRFEGPGGWSGFRGGDEYGNPTLYFRTPLFGVVWWYPTGHYQTEIEMPDPGFHPWIDKVFYGGCDDWCKHEEAGTD